MKVITARNVNSAYYQAVQLLFREGVRRESRNGPVMVMEEPVTVHYTNPCERVLFDIARDGNPFFHLYESLWMLMGRNDIAPLVRYTKQVANYSDDGRTFHGAYGYRWRNYFDFDQLTTIANILRTNPDDRRCVLSMWDPRRDLGKQGRDFPCNTICTLSRNSKGALDLTVFQRSGDLVWGIMGANVVQFSMLLEYMANWIGCPVGSYHQVTTNFHGYVATLPTYIDPPRSVYINKVQTIPISGSIGIVDDFIRSILHDADNGFPYLKSYSEPWAELFYRMLYAHHTFKIHGKLEALKILLEKNQDSDWELAGIEWLERRKG